MSLLNLKWQQAEDDPTFIYALDPKAGVNAFSLQIQRGYFNGRHATAKELAEVGNAIAALPDLLAALINAKRQLEAYELELSGESYNDPELNALLARVTGEKGETNG